MTNIETNPTAIVKEAWATTLGLDLISDERSFAEEGGDSLLVVRFVQRCRRSGVLLRIRDVIQARSLGELLLGLESAVNERPSKAQEPGNWRGLLPGESRWLAGRFADPEHFNLGGAYAVGGEIGDLRVAEAAMRLAGRHEALRTRYPLDPLGEAEVIDVDPTSLIAPPRRDVNPDDPQAVAGAIRDLQVTLSLAEGRTFRLCRLGPPGRAGILVVLVHHIAIDGFGYALLLDELEAALAGEPEESVPAVQPSEIVAAYRAWLSNPAMVRDDALRWRTMGDTAPPIIVRTPGRGRLPTIRTVRAQVALPKLLETARRAPIGALSVEELLLFAILLRTAQWTGRDEMAIDVYHHGRDGLHTDLDLSRTIAYLQVTYPFHLTIGAGSPYTELLRNFAAARRSVPVVHAGFDVLRFGGDRDVMTPLRDLRRPDVRCNFRANYRRFAHAKRNVLKPYDGLFPAARSPRQIENYPLMVEGDLSSNFLTLGIKFSLDHFSEASVQDLAGSISSLMTSERWAS